MHKRIIRKRAVAKRKLDAPPRVYENMGGDVFKGPGVGSLWKMPIQFLHKTGTAITVSLKGEAGKRRVWQRCTGADFHKRLLAALAWKEARVDLGYRNAVVWIGTTRFQPTAEDAANVGCTAEVLDTANANVRVSAPRGKRGKVRKHKEGDEEMSKKRKKGKKSKKSSKGSESSGARTPEERAVSNAAAYSAKLIGTTKLSDEQISSKIQKKFPDCSDAYVSGNAVHSNRKSISEELTRFDWVQKLSGFSMKNVDSHLEDQRPRSSSAKKGKCKVKKVKKVLRKGKVKKVHKRPITKSSKRKVVKKIRR